MVKLLHEIVRSYIHSGREQNVPYHISPYAMSENLTTYTAIVATGDHEGAGTDAKVYVRLFGDLGETEAILLDAPGADPFERAAIDAFTLSLPELGNLSRAEIWHDNSGFRPDWFLVKLEIQHEDGHRWIFPANRWLGRKRTPNGSRATLPALQ